MYVGSGRTGLQPAPFKFTLADFGFTEVNLLRLPRTITFSVFAFAVDADAAANCGVNTTAVLQAQTCSAIASPPAPAGGWFVASNGVPGM